MDDETRSIRDDCRKLAELLDQAESQSGPWAFIPGVAERLFEALSKKVGDGRSDGPRFE